MKTEKYSFAGSHGVDLAARIDLPDDGVPAAFALFAHCFTCSKDLKAVVNIDGALTDQGIGVLRFDFTGLGESEGDFADTGFVSNVEDLVAAAAGTAMTNVFKRVIDFPPVGLRRRLPDDQCRQSVGGVGRYRSLEPVCSSSSASTRDGA